MARRTRAEAEAEVFDRRVAELPINARIVPVEIDDASDRPWTAKPDRIIIMRSVRDDPLGFLHARKRILDVHFAAGRQWEALYERACVGAVQALDTSKEPVDGGPGFPDPITDQQRAAIRLLRQVDIALVSSCPGDKIRGLDRARLVQDIIGRGMSPTQAAALRGQFHWRQVAKLVREFRATLDVVARELGLASNLPKWQKGT